MRPYRIIVGLDCILDTLLGCVHFMDHTLIEPLIKAGYRQRWHNKLSEFVPLIDDKILMEIFQNRDVNILKLSRNTNMVNLLESKILESQIRGDKSPNNRNIQIILNTYPYNLTKEEVNIFVESLALSIKTFNITRIHMSFEELTPKFLLTNYSRLILHDFNEWGKHHIEAIKETPMPLFSLMVPGYINDYTKFVNVINVAHGTYSDDLARQILQEILKHQSRLTSSYIDVEYTGLFDYSFALPNIPIKNESNNSG